MMTWSAWIRQLHRWLSILFTLTVIANFVQLGMGKGNPPNAVTYSPLFPLALMTVSGLYMFALPYVARWRNRHRNHERMRAQREGSVEMTAVSISAGVIRRTSEAARAAAPDTY